MRMWEKAEEIERDVLEKKNVSGEDHPSTLITMHNLACTLQRQGKCDQAITLIEECVETRREKTWNGKPPLFRVLGKVEHVEEDALRRASVVELGCVQAHTKRVCSVDSVVCAPGPIALTFNLNPLMSSSRDHSIFE